MSDQLNRPRTPLGAKAGPPESAALRRLEDSRARIRVAMEAHMRESEPPKDVRRESPRSLAQRLLERARQLPIVRAALEIRDLRRG